MSQTIRNARQHLMLWRNSVRDRYLKVAMEIAAFETQEQRRADNELYLQLDGLKRDLERAADAIDLTPDS